MSEKGLGDIIVNEINSTIASLKNISSNSYHLSSASPESSKLVENSNDDTFATNDILVSDDKEKKNTHENEEKEEHNKPISTNIYPEISKIDETAIEVNKNLSVTRQPVGFRCTICQGGPYTSKEREIHFNENHK